MPQIILGNVLLLYDTQIILLLPYITISRISPKMTLIMSEFLKNLCTLYSVILEYTS